MFEGFRRAVIEISCARLALVRGGTGPPLLLLHGYPQTHVMWHLVAARLAERFTVVAPDLRGYGDSSKPPGGPEHLEYSKRAMDADQVALMAELGFDQFAVVGHDRGGRVAHRLALDQPECVTSFFLRWHLRPWSGGRDDFIAAEAIAEYQRCFADPACVHATCEDYRAGASIDLEHDEADLSHRLSCPLLVLWGEGRLDRHFDVPAVWRERADDVSARALPCGHLLAEELPHETAAELLAFLG